MKKMEYRSFDDNLPHVRFQMETKETAKAWICRLITICRKLSGDLKSYDYHRYENKIGELLAAYSIVIFPHNIFDYFGPTETSLRDMATTFIKLLKDARDTVRMNMPLTSVDNLCNLCFIMDEYLMLYDEWSRVSTERQILRLQCTFVALHKARRLLDTTKPATRMAFNEITDRIDQWSGKLLRLAGRSKMDEIKREIDADSGSSEIDAGTLPTPLFLVHKETELVSILLNNPLYEISERQLLHEMLLIPKLRMKDAGGNDMIDPVFAKIRFLMENAFWESVAGELALGCFAGFINTLSKTQEIIHEYRRQCNFDNRCKIVEIDYVKDQVAMGFFDWNECKALLRNVAQRLFGEMIVPRRKACNTLWAKLNSATNDPVIWCRDALRFLFESARMIFLDKENAKLMVYVTNWDIRGAELERSYVRKIPLPTTTAWIHAAVDRAMKTSANAAALRAGSSEAFAQIYNDALIRLITTTPFAHDEVPETLSLDTYRMEKMNRDFATFVCDAIILVLVKSNTSRNPAISKTIETIANKTALDVDRAIDEIYAFSPAIAEAMRPVLQLHTDNPSSVVAVSVSKILVRAWTKMLTGAPIDSLLSDDSPHTRPLRALIPRMLRTVATLRRMADVNRNVHGERYNGMIAECVAKV
jgi:hypothetical protein